MSQSLKFFAALSLLLASSMLIPEKTAVASEAVQITGLTNRLRVEINGQLFTEYYFKDVPRPYCYPLIGPGEAAMTRDYPMKSPPGEDHDHLHHRSLWYAHGMVNGQDFWTEQKNFGKIVHDSFPEIKSGDKFGLIRSKNRWVAHDGSTVVCTDDRILRIYKPENDNERVFDFEITLHASNGDLTFGDTKEGTMAVRVAESMKLKRPGEHGHIVNSAGARDDKTWGKRADWCDYYGPIGGKIYGIAIFDNPKNPRHPTSWHVRDYGLFAANPFGLHDFESLPDKNAGNLTVKSGESITFRYRFYLHTGDTDSAKVAKKYQDYAKEDVSAAK